MPLQRYAGWPWVLVPFVLSDRPPLAGAGGGGAVRTVSRRNERSHHAPPRAQTAYPYLVPRTSYFVPRSSDLSPRTSYLALLPQRVTPALALCLTSRCNNHPSLRAKNNTLA